MKPDSILCLIDVYYVIQNLDIHKSLFYFIYFFFIFFFFQIPNCTVFSKSDIMSSTGLFC